MFSMMLVGIGHQALGIGSSVWALDGDVMYWTYGDLNLVRALSATQQNAKYKTSNVL
jgi:hypothetical protein